MHTSPFTLRRALFPGYDNRTTCIAKDERGTGHAALLCVRDVCRIGRRARQNVVCLGRCIEQLIAGTVAARLVELDGTVDDHAID